MTTSQNSNRPADTAKATAASSTQTAQPKQPSATKPTAAKTSATATKTPVKPAVAENSSPRESASVPQTVRAESPSEPIADQIKVFPRRRVWPD